VAHDKTIGSWVMVMGKHGKPCSFGISSEMSIRDLIGIGLHQIIDFNWYELKRQTDWNVTLFLANQYSLMKQLDMILC
jgi:hypothetical protein